MNAVTTLEVNGYDVWSEGGKIHFKNRTESLPTPEVKKAIDYMRTHKAEVLDFMSKKNATKLTNATEGRPETPQVEEILSSKPQDQGKDYTPVMCAYGGRDPWPTHPAACKWHRDEKDPKCVGCVNNLQPGKEGPPCRLIQTSK